MAVKIKLKRMGKMRNAQYRIVVADARTNGDSNPLGTFTQLTQADADLDRLLATVTEEREASDRLERSYEQALATAESRVRSVSDYVDTRRGTNASGSFSRGNNLPIAAVPKASVPVGAVLATCSVLRPVTRLPSA